MGKYKRTIQSISTNCHTPQRLVGMWRLCWHYFEHNRYVWESGIMLAV